MTIQYKTTESTKALEYIRIHLSDGYFVSAYKSGIDYIVRISGVEEVKDEPQEEEYINNLPWTEVGNGEQPDCQRK